MTQQIFSTKAQQAMDAMLVKVPYGSHLYGTNTPTSDRDFKVIYLPDINDVLLGRKITNFKANFDKDNRPMAMDVPVGADGTEVEFIALQTYLRDYLEGQTYAVELAMAINQGHGIDTDDDMLDINRNLLAYPITSVSAMAGFAIKQTFDYVHRGKRLNAALKLKEVLESIDLSLYAPVRGSVRLDSVHIDSPETVLFDPVWILLSGSEEADNFKIEMIENGTRRQRALVYAGRQYVDSTPISELVSLVNARIKSYGTRSTDSAEKGVDPKSLMHAIRVYQQIIELTETGSIQFPRPNAQALLGVRSGQYSEDTIKQMLTELDAQVEQLPAVMDEETKQEVRAAFEEWTLRVLRYMYYIGDEELADELEEDDIVEDDIAEVQLGRSNLSLLDETRKSISDAWALIANKPQVQNLKDRIKSLTSK